MRIAVAIAIAICVRSSVRGGVCSELLGAVGASDLGELNRTALGRLTTG